VVVLATELTPELLREGLARDLIRLIQDRRKDLGLEYTDRISVTIRTEDAETAAAVRENESLIAGETLSDRIAVDRGPLIDSATVDSASVDAASADVELAELGDHKIRLRVAKIS
jgi:isoleucyl-tRNA synthetase